MNYLRILWQFRGPIMLIGLILVTVWALQQRQARIAAEVHLAAANAEIAAQAASAVKKLENTQNIGRAVKRAETKIKTISEPCLDQPLPDGLAGVLNAPITTRRTESPVQ